MKITLAAGLALAIGIALCSCGTGLDDPGDTFLMDINNQWTVQGSNGNHTFSFVCVATDPTHKASTCNFTGNEQLNGSSSDLTGVYNERQIQFTVNRGGGAVRFQGTIADENTMTLSGGGQNLTVTRG